MILILINLMIEKVVYSNSSLKEILIKIKLFIALKYGGKYGKREFR